MAAVVRLTLLPFVLFTTSAVTSMPLDAAVVQKVARLGSAGAEQSFTESKCPKKTRRQGGVSYNKIPPPPAPEGLPQPPIPNIGGEKDPHGCIPSAGERWCESLSRCVQIQIENCPSLGTAPSPQPQEEGEVPWESSDVPWEDDECAREVIVRENHIAKRIFKERASEETWLYNRRRAHHLAMPYDYECLPANQSHLPKEPANWGSISPEYALCAAGKMQSPIDITDAVVSRALNSLDTHYGETTAWFRWNGHTMQLEYQQGSDNYVWFRDVLYDLTHVHFHAPSEHLVDGKASAMEIQLVHRSRYKNVGRFVLSVLVEEGEKNNFISDFWWGINDVAANVSANAAEVLPYPDTGYYLYEGSLTEPPCQESVVHVVMSTPVTASCAQVGKFKKSMEKAGVCSGSNARPIQPLHKRQVLQFSPDCNSTNTSKKEVLPPGTCPAWTYLTTDFNHTREPCHWHEICDAYKLCGSGPAQSPINIANPVSDESLTPVEFIIGTANMTIVSDEYSFYLKPKTFVATPVQLVESGEAVTLIAAAMSPSPSPSSAIPKPTAIPTPTPSVAPRVVQDNSSAPTIKYRGLVYELERVTFHHPSEHRVNEVALDMEVQLFYRPLQPQKSLGTLAVSVALVNGVSNPWLEELLLNMPEKPGTSSEIKLNMSAILPKELENAGYYTYLGSYNVPPCSENATWIVMKEAVEVDRLQVERYKRLMFKRFHVIDGTNVRELQKIGSRTILQYDGSPLEFGGQMHQGKLTVENNIASPSSSKSLFPNTDVTADLDFNGVKVWADESLLAATVVKKPPLSSTIRSGNSAAPTSPQLTNQQPASDYKKAASGGPQKETRVTTRVVELPGGKRIVQKITKVVSREEVSE